MKVAAPPVLPTLLTVSPASFDFSVELTDTVLTVDKIGTDSITVQSVNVDAEWLAIEELNPGAGESGIFPTQYRVQVDRSGLAPGDYGATIIIASDSNTVEVPVTMKVIPPTLLTVSRDIIRLGSTRCPVPILRSIKMGADSITVQSVNFDADWLAIEEINPGAGQSGIFPTQYRVQVDRTSLAPGDYEATITLESENNTVEVSVSCRWPTSPMLPTAPFTCS